MEQSMSTKALAGEEIWQNTMKGLLYYFVTEEGSHKRINRSVRGGQQFRISAYDRELNSDSISREERDPFRNGRLKRVDDRIRTEDTPVEKVPETTPLPEGHQVDQALVEGDLVAIFEKNGMAFQTAVKKLDERNVRQLKAIVESGDVDASVKQSEFLDKYIAENFREGGATSDGKELLADAPE